MSRERLTRKKQADPYTLGRDKENPPVEKYMNGDPEKWAEGVNHDHPWESEKREETGHAAPAKDMSGDFGEKSKSAAIKQAKELKAKAIKCVRLAEALLKNASETELEAQGFDFMELSERALQATLDRITAFEGAQEKAASEATAVAEAREEIKQASQEEKTAKTVVAEEDDEDEDEEMSESEKKASLLVKRADYLVSQAEYEGALGNADKADALKKEARSVLATAKKVLAGDLNLEAPAEIKEASEKKADEAPADMSTGAPVDADGKPKDAAPADKDMTVHAKIEEATRYFEAAQKLMAEVKAAAPAAAETAPVVASEAPKTEKVAEGMNADLSNSQVPAALDGGAAEEDEDEDEEKAMEEDEEEECAMEEEEEAYEHDLGLDAGMPAQGHSELDGLFMTPEMAKAKEAYEMAFGMKGDEAAMPAAPATAPVMDPAAASAAAPAPAPEMKAAATKTASKKKGAKTLGSGIKASAVSQTSDDLQNLWDAPPDVSHLFK